MIRVKFRVTSIERTQSSTARVDAQGRPQKDPRGKTVWDRVEVRSVSLAAQDEDDPATWQGNPAGSVRLGPLVVAAADNIELGGEYTLDFTKVGETP